MTVSDRAKALVKVAGSSYLSTISMPDLFHLMQDLGGAVGSKLGLQVYQLYKKLDGKDCQSVDYDLLREDLVAKQEQVKKYKSLRETINKVVHPFNDKDELIEAEQLSVQLHTTFTDIRALANQAGITIALSKGQKIVNQILDITNGVSSWVKWLKTKVADLDLSVQQQDWLMNSLLPYVYWQIHLTKKTTKKKDKQLNVYYQNRIQAAKTKFEKDPLTSKITVRQKEALVNWAFRHLATFHRASSQVEGRNGYLAFVHHANKGIHHRRKKVLTVIHNFDIRRDDGKTPAQRLFHKDFGHLFEFVLDKVEALPKPRTRKMKTGIKY